VSTLALTLAPPRSRTSARLAFQVACAVVGSALLAGLAQISLHLGFSPVPITGQTLGVLLVGAAYGPGLGTATVLLYLLEGVIGLPVFATNSNGGHDTGLKVIQLVGTTGGYLWGFVLAGALTGWLARRGWDRSFRSAIGAMLLGEVVIYAIGVPWLHHALPALMGKPVSWETTYELGLYPYVIGDFIKLLAAAGLLPGAWWLMKQVRPRDAGA
jgi:biotin transport system substrate-specific component